MKEDKEVCGWISGVVLDPPDLWEGATGKSQVKQPFPSGGCRAGFREKGHLYPCNKRNTANKVTPSFRQEQEAVWKQAASGLLSLTLAFVSKSLARGHVVSDIKQDCSKAELNASLE